MFNLREFLDRRKRKKRLREIYEYDRSHYAPLPPREALQMWQKSARRRKRGDGENENTQ